MIYNFRPNLSSLDTPFKRDLYIKIRFFIFSIFMVPCTCKQDGIPTELIEASGELGVEMFLAICREIWISRRWLRKWTDSVFIPLHKKESKNKCDNYRLIALVSHASKIMLHILHSRIRSFLDSQIHEE